jgi:hypothetical protein
MSKRTLDRLSKLASELSSALTEATKKLRQLEKYLQRINPGITACVPFGAHYYLCWCKTRDEYPRWQLMVDDSRGNLIHVFQAEMDVLIAASLCIDKLVQTLSNNVERMLKDTKAAVEILEG